MSRWQKRITSSFLLGWIAISGGAFAETPTELKKIISDQLLYPRDARYTIQAALPSDAVDQTQNSEWLAVATQLSKAGLIRLTKTSGKTFLDGTEKSLDVVIPSMNLRYETTALNVILGRWDIDVVKVTSRQGLTIAYGKRHLIKRSRAYDLVLDSLPPNKAAKYVEQQMIWTISRLGTSFDVVEKAE